MPPMDRKTLTEILGRAPGVKHAKNRYEVSKDHRLTFYLGQPGRAMVVPDVASCALEETYLEIQSRDDGAVFFAMFDAVEAIAVRPSSAPAEKRTGFS